MNARSTTLAAVFPALLAACGGGGSGGTRAVEPGAGCSTSAPPMPFAHIGPDATLHVLCGSAGAVAVASVDERGPGVTSWSVSVKGAPADAFKFRQSSFQTCQALGPSVAILSFAVPPGTASMPGDTFDAVVTVHADDGAFADGTVKVHVEVVVASVIVDKTTLDFGDALPGVPVEQIVSFITPPGAGATVRPTPFPNPPFSTFQLGPLPLQPANVSRWSITFESFVPGDFSESLAFTTELPTTSLLACQSTTTIGMHGRVPDDGGADAGADGDAP